MNDVRTAPWVWRKASGGFVADSEVRDLPLGGLHRRFHACDVNANLACHPRLVLAGTCEEPNEGSDLCPDCIEVVREQPGGRELRVYS